jgi:Double zinc ribbon/Adenylate and Guanylate cyclase catalytic domain
MDCPSCSHPIDASAGACGMCGISLEMICDDCGRRSGIGDAFCAGCGSRLATVAATAAVGPVADVATGPREESITRQASHNRSPHRSDGQRRVMTIVMSDLSGYTAMCEQFDAELIAEIMGLIKADGTAIIESFGGIVNQFIGDEIVSLFGLPTAGDDDARRAVSAALALHERVAERNTRTPDAGAALDAHRHPYRTAGHRDQRQP